MAPPPSVGQSRAGRRLRMAVAVIALCAAVAVAAAIQLTGEVRGWLDTGLGACGCRPPSHSGAILGLGGLTALLDVLVIAGAGTAAVAVRRFLQR